MNKLRQFLNMDIEGLSLSERAEYISMLDKLELENSILRSLLALIQSQVESTLSHPECNDKIMEFISEEIDRQSEYIHRKNLSYSEPGEA